MRWNGNRLRHNHASNHALYPRCYFSSPLRSYYYDPPPGGGIKRWCCRMSDICLCDCLSVAYIGTKSRTEKPRETKIGAEVAHVTRDSDTTFKVKRSRSQRGGGILRRPSVQLVTFAKEVYISAFVCLWMQDNSKRCRQILVEFYLVEWNAWTATSDQILVHPGGSGIFKKEFCGI